MLSKVFEKGEKWLEAYEKYLKNGILPLELEEMQLINEDEEILEKKIEQQQRLQRLLLLALSMFQLDFNVLHQLWHISNKARDILSQRDLTALPIETQQRQVPAAELARIERVNEEPSEILMAELQNAIKEYKAVWPRRLIVLLKRLSQKLIQARQFIFEIFQVQMQMQR